MGEREGMAWCDIGLLEEVEIMTLSILERGITDTDDIIMVLGCSIFTATGVFDFHLIDLFDFDIYLSHRSFSTRPDGL